MKSIEEKLKELKLNNSIARYSELAKFCAKKNIGCESYLDMLLDEEILHKRNKLIERRIREAKMGVLKSIEDFDFKHPKKINRQAVISLCDLDFIKKHVWVVIVGSPGLGKTHIGKAILLKAAQNCFRVRYIKASHLVEDMGAAETNNTQKRVRNYFTGLDILMIDEMGYLPLDDEKASRLFNIISDRYEAEKGANIITTNLAFRDWTRIFRDNALAQAIVDRIAHRCCVLKIEGESFRLKK